MAYIDLKRFGAHTTPEGRLYVQRCLSRFCWRTRHEGIAMDCNRPSCWKHRRGTGTGGSRLYFCLTFRGKVRLFIPVTKENGFKGWTMKDGEDGGIGGIDHPKVYGIGNSHLTPPYSLSDGTVPKAKL